jgi:2-polyprenyl-6-methoxyphenol hydroxylase-like FAD-dependent oxidoreductase
MHVLISGGSIAGPSLAWWLHRFGIKATIVEKAPAPRPGGHAIDIRGSALDVARAMGVEDRIRQARTRMKGVSKLDAEGNEVWRSETMTISGGSFDKEAVEILRDDLSNILTDALPPEVEVIYGNTICALSDTGNAVTATFTSGPQRRFDVVIGADGLGSAMRKLVFGPDDEFLHPFGVVLAPYSTPNIIGLEDWQLTYASGQDSCMIYTAPGNHSLRVCFGFPARLEEVPADRDGQVALVRSRCSHMGWAVPQLLDMLEQSHDFYLGPIAQVKMKQWHKGRVALVGDAAYCPSPFTGQGTSLAMVGAYVLARELARDPGNPEAAFTACEARMRPFVDKNQALATLTRDPRFTEDPDYYAQVIEPAMAAAEYAIDLPELDPEPAR